MNSQWVVISAIISMRVKHGKQRNIPVYENFYLMELFSGEDINIKAEEFVRSQLVEDSSLTLNGRPTYFSFEGIRKIISVSNPITEEIVDSRPVHGTELTYSEYVLRNETQIKKLVNGEEVKLRYID